MPIDPEHNEYALRLIRFKVGRICRQRGFAKSDEEVIEHDLRTHLELQMARYDPSRGQVTTFIDRVVARWIISYLRRHFADKRDPRREECSLNEVVLDADGREVERHETTPEAASDAGRLLDLQRDMASVLSGLSDDLRAAALGLAAGTPHGVGMELGMSRRDMPKIMDQLREIFRDVELDKYL